MRTRSGICAILVVVALAATPGIGQNTIDQMKRAAEQAAAAAAAARSARNARNPQQQPAQQAAQAPAQLAAKVTETVMGPRAPEVFLSADGDHIAIPSNKGSRLMVIVDGVDGPAFDEVGRLMIGMNQTQITLSPSGGRSAYVGRRGGDLIAVIDGKEAGTITTLDGLRGPVAMSLMGWKFWFSRDGAHLAYPIIDNGKWVMIVDGKKGTPYSQINFQLSMMNGSRFAYIAETADHKQHVVVDEKELPAYDSIDWLQITPDGAHYAFSAAKGTSRFIVLDGNESKAYSSITDPELAPSGQISYLATIPGEPVQPGHGTSPQWLMVGDTQASYDTTTFNVVEARTQKHVALSPDGKRFAYVKQILSSQSVAVFVDGKQVGPEYAHVTDLQFSPDGKRFGFFGTARNQMQFPIIDGEEGEGSSRLSELQFSADSKHVAFVGYGANGGLTITIDGKLQPQAGQVQQQTMTFSPKGSHYAYAATVNLTAVGPVVDGKPIPSMLGSFRTRTQPNPPIKFPTFYYSPDGEHMAYVSARQEGTNRPAIVADGKAYEITAAIFSYPSFTTDGKHFSCMTYANQKFSAMIDGKTGPLYDDIIEVDTSACRFVDDHTLRYWAVKDGKVYRVILDLNG